MVRSVSIRCKVFTGVMVVLGLIFKLKFQLWFLADEHTAAISVINFTLPLILHFTPYWPKLRRTSLWK